MRNGGIGNCSLSHRRCLISLGFGGVCRTYGVGNKYCREFEEFLESSLVFDPHLVLLFPSSLKVFINSAMTAGDISIDSARCRVLSQGKCNWPASPAARKQASSQDAVAQLIGYTSLNVDQSDIQPVQIDTKMAGSGSVPPLVEQTDRDHPNCSNV